MCGLAIETRDGIAVSIRGDPDDPLSRGHLCPKALALKDVHEDPDRLHRPLRRRGRDWEEVSWDAALDEAAERLRAVQRAHGRNAVAFYQGNPTVHNYGALVFSQLFQQSLGSRSRFSATSVDQLPHMLASLLMFGHALLLPIPDVDRTCFFLVFGANPVASNGSLLTAPGMARRLRELRARGGRLVVVDPRRTETAALADLHLAIRPGSDALLLLAMVHTLFREGLVRPGRLAAVTDGVDAIAAAARDFPPDAVAAATGISAEQIQTLARDFAAAPSAAAYGRVGISTQEFGALACWLVNVLNLLTGNLDREGGVMFTRPAVDLVGLSALLGQRGHFDKGRSRVRGLPEFGGEWPAAVLAEEMETEGPGQIRALVSSAGNPVLSTPNGARLGRALERLDFMVSIDIYRNETSRHAHLILPPTFGLERDHYDLAFHIFAVRNTAKFSSALLAAAPGAKHDWEILLELATRIDIAAGRGLRARLKRGALRMLGPKGILALLLRFGPHGAGFSPFARGVSLRGLRRAPHGVDLGPLEPCLPERLYTPSGRVALAPSRLLGDLPRLTEHLRARPPALCLIGRRHVRSNNSWMHNSARLVDGPDRCSLLMHPEDAEARGLRAGQRVRVSSRVGQVTVPVDLTEAMRPGVVSLPHGWGHDKQGGGLRIAAEHPGASTNDLTDDQRVDQLCGNAAFSAVPVEVDPAQ
jgi:anaerobic selenocysteine-containing dehydrogenase